MTQKSNYQYSLDHRNRTKSESDQTKSDQDQKNSASLITLKSLTVWITTNCGKFLEMEVPDHLTCLLRNLYAGQEATVRTRPGKID